MLPVYRHIYDFLESVGCDVVSWHVVDLGSDEEEADMGEQEIYLRDIGLLEESDCMVAEVTVPSIGVGYEVCRALGLGLPVLCVHSAGANVSAMVLGNPNLQGRVRKYSSLDDLEQILYEFAGVLGDSND
jgi:nucleoside 2-deoxyribosyltransferase